MAKRLSALLVTVWENDSLLRYHRMAAIRIMDKAADNLQIPEIELIHVWRNNV